MTEIDWNSVGKKFRWRLEPSTLESDRRTLISDRSINWTFKNELQCRLWQLHPTEIDRKIFPMTIGALYFRIRSENFYFRYIDRTNIPIFKSEFFPFFLSFWQTTLEFGIWTLEVVCYRVFFAHWVIINANPNSLRVQLHNLVLFISLLLFYLDMYKYKYEYCSVSIWFLPILVKPNWTN